MTPETNVQIRQANSKDFNALYALGRGTPEFQVSSSGEFMEADEFRSAVENSKGVFLLAEAHGEVAGFVYASCQDLERGPATKWACLVYLVVALEFRNRGIAQALYNACIVELQKRGMARIYAWANNEGDGSIIGFMKKNGFSEGHRYVWMDKEL
jgi:predicted N-acetyltransferase YhbS